MDEEQFFEHLDKKFEAVGLLLGDIVDDLDNINIELKLIKDIVEIKGVVKTTLADFSKEPKAKSTYAKPMPEKIGDWIIAKKGCNSCGGKISWDNYDKEEHPYPDHVDENGNLVDCPNYQPKD